jgi:hypothetical protein
MATGICQMASSSVVIIQPQVNSTTRRREDIDSRCLMSSWLAPDNPLRHGRAGGQV